MKKIINTLVLTLVSVISFAQQARPERSFRFEEEVRNEEIGYGPGDNGGQFVSVDNYTMLLITVAVFIIGYVIYKQRQAKIA